MPRIPSPAECKDGSSLISGPRGPPEVLTLGRRYTPAPRAVSSWLRLCFLTLKYWGVPYAQSSALLASFTPVHGTNSHLCTDDPQTSALCSRLGRVSLGHSISKLTERPDDPAPLGCDPAPLGCLPTGSHLSLRGQPV